MSMSKRSAVVTGSARGIGRAVAERLVASGYAVVVTDIDAEEARRTADEIGAAAGMAQDVREEASHLAVAEEAMRHGSLAVWVNNAGVGYDGDLINLSSRQIDALVDVNFRGMVWGMRAALALMDSGDIINIASLSGLGPVPGLSVYAATKAAVVSLTTSVALEAPDGIRVHALCPDGVATRLVARMDDEGSAKALVHSGGGLLDPGQVADAAMSLVGSRRVLRALPAWRGAVMRSGSLAPSIAGPAFPVMERIGRAVMARRRGP